MFNSSDQSVGREKKYRIITSKVTVSVITRIIQPHNKPIFSFTNSIYLINLLMTALKLAESTKSNEDGMRMTANQWDGKYFPSRTVK